MRSPGSSSSSSGDHSTDEDVTSLSTTPSHSPAKSNSVSQNASTSEESTSSRNGDVSSPISKHHHILPPGWRCKYDTKTKKYHFYRDEAENQQRSESATSQTSKLPTTTTHLMDPEEHHHEQRSASAQTSRRPSDDQKYKCSYEYHFPSSPTPSMISALADQVANSAALKAVKARTKPTGTAANISELECMQRLCKMFPTAPEALVVHMTKTYHQRENLIIASLISQGFRRVSDKPLSGAGAIDPAALIITRPASKKLLDKLTGYFPDRDESYIKSLMVKYNEVEHDIITAIVESSSVTGQSTTSSSGRRTGTDRSTHHRQTPGSWLDDDKDGAMMKLRYLKFLYPEMDELEIFHMLHSHDMNAQSVTEKIEARGFKKSDIEAIVKKRKALHQQMKAQQAVRSAAAAAKDKAKLKPGDTSKKPPKPNITKERLATMKGTLKKEFPNVCDELIDIAIDAANYSEGSARRCLRDMPDENHIRKMRFMIGAPLAPHMIIYPSKFTQTLVDYKDVVAGSPVKIKRDLVEMDENNQWTVALIKESVGTWTGEDNMNEPTNKTLAQGRVFSNYEGSKYSGRVIPRKSLFKGTKAIPLGPNPMNCAPKKLMSAQDAIEPRKSTALGQNPSRRKGPNIMMLKKPHPFFL